MIDFDTILDFYKTLILNVGLFGIFWKSIKKKELKQSDIEIPVLKNNEVELSGFLLLCIDIFEIISQFYIFLFIDLFLFSMYCNAVCRDTQGFCG